MGVLHKLIEEVFDKKYREILELAETSDMAKDRIRHIGIVYRCFYVLRPLSYKFKPIVLEEERGYSYVFWYGYYIGTWINRILLGENTNRRKGQRGLPLDDTELYRFVRKYGDRLPKAVRRPIREPVSTIVTCVKGLVEYRDLCEDVVLEAVVPLDLLNNSFITRESVEVQAVSVCSGYPYRLSFIGRDGIEVASARILEVSTMIALEDYLDDIYTLYRRLADRVSEARRHNESLIKKMVEAVKPYEVASRIKS